MSNRARSPEQKEAARKITLSANPKLKRFLVEFLYPLLAAYEGFKRGEEVEQSPDGKLVFISYEHPERGTQRYFEVSTVWMRKEFGEKAVEIFKKLFRRIAKGGRMLDSTVINSSWAPNEPYYTKVRFAYTTMLCKHGFVDVYEMVSLVQDAEQYVFAYTDYMREFNQRTGRYDVKGVHGSKVMKPKTDQLFVDAAMKRKALQVEAKALNEAIMLEKQERPARILAELKQRKLLEVA